MMKVLREIEDLPIDFSNIHDRPWTYFRPDTRTFESMNNHPQCWNYPFHHLVISRFKMYDEEVCIWCNMPTCWIDIERADQYEAII